MQGLRLTEAGEVRKTCKTESANAQSRRFLVAEDEADIARLLALHLREFPAEVKTCSNGAEALALAMKEPWDAMILDLHLPAVDGIDICRALREVESRLPIIMLTSRTTEEDRIEGLESGADDYLTKPFSVMELLARIKAVLRRSEYFPVSEQHSASPDSRLECLQIGALLIDPRTRQVTLDGHALEMTSKEFELLSFFARQPEQVFTRSELLDKVWGYGHEGYEHTVNSHINRLRNKLDAHAKELAGKKNCIDTVWGVGYRLNPESLLR